ncbi:hypothetical protein ACG2K1_02140 [Neisseria sp. 23W00296]|uniref:hypothetical protein n=1 Tax=unclassified Neisseria TaxID=2623750 RepID=UPI0037568810
MKLPAAAEFNRDIMLCKQALQGGRTIAVYKCLIAVAGSVKAAVFLSQLVYWTRHGRDTAAAQGWIFKSVAQMFEETGLSEREQGTCKKKLQERGLIETRYRRFGFAKSRLELRLNLERLARAVCTANGVPCPEGAPAPTLHESDLFFLRYFKERIAYHRDLVELTGCIHSALMLSFMLQQCIAKGSGSGQERWFVSFNIPAWQQHLSLPYKTQLTARNKLKSRKFIVEKHFYASRRIFTLINGQAIWQALQNRRSRFLPVQPENGNTAVSPAETLAEHTPDKWENTAVAFSENTPDKRANTVVHFSENTPDKRENTQPTNGKIHTRQKGKYTADKSENTHPTKGEIVKVLDYRQFPIGNNYNNTPPLQMQHRQPESTQDVVVGNGGFFSPSPSRHDGLVYPKTFGSSLQNNARQIFDKLLPETTAERLQEILDEIAGQTKPVTSPLGLLTVLCRKETAGELICVVAPLARQNRERQTAWAAAYENQAQQSAPKHEARRTAESDAARDKAMEEMRQNLKRQGLCGLHTDSDAAGL